MLDETLVAVANDEGVEKFVVGAVIHDDSRALIVTRSDDDDFLPGIEELPSGGVESMVATWSFATIVAERRRSAQTRPNAS